MAERDWQLDAAAEGIATMDEQRITQAVLQLADNAVKHTEPGDTIAIGSEIRGDTVELWVRDPGPGVPASDRHHIFSRFGRSVVRPDDEGFGLGLSIVDAIAQAHGTASLADDDAPGARFLITLPTRPETT